MIALLWLSPSHDSFDADAIDAAADATGAVDESVLGGVGLARADGVRIFDEYATGLLFSQGVSVYPSVHPDFLSRSSDLHINMTARCGDDNSVYVPRKANRLVLVQPRKPLALVSSGAEALPPAMRSDAADNFKHRVAMAFVVVLSGLKQ